MASISATLTVPVQDLSLFPGSFADSKYCFSTKVSIAIPALLTRTSTPPKTLSISENILLTCAESETSHLKISTGDNSVEISCMVKNAGEFKAKETVQLYIGDVECSVKRPIKELMDLLAHISMKVILKNI